MTRMIKRSTALMLVLILAVSLLPISAAAAGQVVRFELDGLEYYGDATGLTVISCSENSAEDNINIPETVIYHGKTYTVTGIANGAFYGLGEGFSIRSVTIPASVGYIGPFAFKNCRELEAVTFAEGSVLTQLPEEVFADCYLLNSINIPAGVTSIGEKAFYYCYELRKITLPDGLSGIGDKAFFNTVLPSVTIPASVETIGTNAFRTYAYFDPRSLTSERTLKTVCYQGSRSAWNSLVEGKDIGIGSAAVYTKATITFDTMGQGTAPDPVSVDPLSRPSSAVGVDGPYVIDGAYAVDGWYEDETLSKPFDFEALLEDDVTVYAKWGDRKYTVAVRTVSGETVEKSCYTLTPGDANMFLPGTEVSVTIPVYNFPDLSGALLDGVRLKSAYAKGKYFFTMPHHDAVITVVLDSDPSYPVNVQSEPEQGGNAYIENVRRAIEGERVKVGQWAYDGYRFMEWQTTGGAVIDEDGVFIMPAEEVSITAVFEPEYTVIRLNGDGSRLVSAVYYGDEEEPVTDLIPEKADEGNYSYTFEGWDEGTVSGHTTTYTPIFSRTLKDIPLWLGDTQITGENCADIPSVTDGMASFDPETNTLTLDNVKKVRGKHDDAILYSELSELNVRMIGANRLNYSFLTDAGTADSSKYGIKAYGAIHFTDGSEGSLSLAGFEQAIVISGAMSVESGSVSCSMLGHIFERIDDSKSVVDCGDITLNGGSLTVDAVCRANGTWRTGGSMVFGSDDTYLLEGVNCIGFEMNGGSLSVKNASSAVAASASVQIKSGQVSITDIRSVGLYSPQIIICGTDTDVSVSTAKYAVYSTSSLTLSDEVAIISPEGAYTGNGKIWNAGGTMATDVRIATKEYTVTVDLGDLGDEITVPVRHGSRFFDALDSAGVFDTLITMETEDYLFRDLATKPLSEFSDADEFSDDAGALLDTTVTSDMTVYACFYQKIKNVSLTLEKPVIGTEVTVKDGIQTPAPVLHCEEGANYLIYTDPDFQYSQWYVNNNNNISTFEGTFEEDETYYVDCLLMPDFGYWLDDDTVVTVNGAKVEDSSGVMALSVSLSAQADAPALLGDANGDGEIEVVDATLIQRYLTDITVPYPLYILMNGDIDGDGELSVVDATFIQRFCADMYTPYPIGETFIEKK